MELLSITASKLFPPYVPRVGDHSLPPHRAHATVISRLSCSYFSISYLKMQKIISFNSLSFRHKIHLVSFCRPRTMQNFLSGKFLSVYSNKFPSESHHKTLSFFFHNLSKYGKISENTQAQTVLCRSAEKTYPRLPRNFICPDDIGT